MGKAAALEIPERCWARLRAMFDFVRHYLKPDGTAPLIGDSDDGRLIRFKSRPAVDHSYLMSLGAILLEDQTFKLTENIDEEAIWWFGKHGLQVFQELPRNEAASESKAFEDAQIYIQRSGKVYAIADCGDSGARGRGSHAHSDALSVEIFAFGQTFLRDPGTFVYTASERWRNKFRSTPYHNAVRVDGREMCEIIKGQPFVLGNVRPLVRRWESTPDADVLDAEHAGYARLASPVVHRRTLTFNKRQRYWALEDYFTGDGHETQPVHWLEFYFNFDHGVTVKFQENQRALAHADSAALAIVPLSGHLFETRVTTRWVSLSYGTRSRSFGIIYRLYAQVPFSSKMLLIPYERGDEGKVQEVLGLETASKASSERR
jgi:hypothetical protein